MAGSRKKAKTMGQGSSSGTRSSSGLLAKTWEQLSSVEDGDGRLSRPDWVWEKYRNSHSASIWDNDKKKAISTFNDKKLEIKLWKWKMVTNVSTSIPERVVPERSVNVEELRTIGFTQVFERLGWERVLDWCEENTP
ncbi:hypothetical protein Hanom_Chr16g01439771 [Helianthus anomalus]